MHSSVLIQVLNFISDFFVNYELPWDTGTWTIWSYITFCFILYVLAFFVWHVLLFPLRQKYGEGS